MNYKEALSRLQDLCSKSERCEKDILDKLRAWNFQGDARPIIDSLKQDKFIDEERYTRAFVNDKIKFSAWGKNKILFTLKSKGIKEAIVKSYLGDYPIEDYIKRVEHEIIKKNRDIREENPYKRKQKLLAFAFQRGYENEIVYDFIDSITGIE
ncbi:MAG: RecX family transcriptional regulator [Bacteroidales bacterium]|nr:RecX family transcriptional regulator [Bacteroidales bacterium]MBN2821271.1 RecX family transcriptional regulator [Bacteroidales bacterium]